MIITESSVQLHAQHEKSQIATRSESLQIQFNTPSVANEPLQLSEAARSPRSLQAETVDPQAPDEPLEELDLLILRRLTEMLIGKKIHLQHKKNLAPPAATPAVSPGENPVAAQPAAPFGLVYSYHESYQEQEQLQFSATAQVQTADGHQLDLAIDLRLSRAFYQESQFELRAGSALQDPLVINFSGTAAQLTSERFSFDLDLDGAEDQIAVLAPGSGYLALDRNSDGRINDGSELFGPRTNDGFAELAGFDEDSNGWIDEADSLYDRLRVWTTTADGSQQLLALGQAGIGALYLGRVATPFSHTDSANNLLGATRETGLFLFEDGRAGTLQQLDLVV
ncbi:hypothetical protein [Desulfuromonas thiophila]|uniref:hypothetical protein n=1 Tax=Desulfuromonas thiophila TaxID=57664 RepID=UPI0024A8A414|nr:hypothetical protein [Desulfuromonas thiophila]